MKRSFIRAVAVALVGTGGAFAQSALPGSATDVRPESRAAAPASSVQSAPARGGSTVAAASPATPYSNGSASGPTWAAPPTESYSDRCGLPAGCLDDCGPGYHVWGLGEYVLWNMKDGSIPDLTARPPIGVLTVLATDRERIRNANGTVGPYVITDQTRGFFPATIQVIPTIPEGPVELGNHSGVRFGGGMWFTPDRMLGGEVNFFMLGKRTARFNNTATNANGQFIFNTPFSDRDFEVAASGGDRTLIASRTIFFVRQASSELAGAYATNSWGGEANIRSTWVCFGGTTVGGLAGFRYIDFHESFDLSGRFMLFRPNIIGYSDPPFSNLAARMDIVTRDTILTKNRFYGGQVGLDFDGMCGGFFWNVRPRIALGGVHQIVQVAGSSTTLLDGTVTNTQPGGLLFAPLDIGQYKRTRITVIPELNLKAGYQFNNCIRAYVGYDIMGFVNMVRPGELSVASSTSTQITSAPAAGSSGSNTTTIVNVTQPTFRYNDSDVLIQGINFGIEFRY